MNHEMKNANSKKKERLMCMTITTATAVCLGGYICYKTGVKVGFKNGMNSGLELEALRIQNAIATAFGENANSIIDKINEGISANYPK